MTVAYQPLYTLFHYEERLPGHSLHILQKTGAEARFSIEQFDFQRLVCFPDVNGYFGGQSFRKIGIDFHRNLTINSVSMPEFANSQKYRLAPYWRVCIVLIHFSTGE